MSLDLPGLVPSGVGEALESSVVEQESAVALGLRYQLVHLLGWRSQADRRLRCAGAGAKQDAPAGAAGVIRERIRRASTSLPVDA